MVPIIKIPSYTFYCPYYTHIAQSILHEHCMLHEHVNLTQSVLHNAQFLLQAHCSVLVTWPLSSPCYMRIAWSVLHDHFQSIVYAIVYACPLQGFCNVKTALINIIPGYHKIISITEIKVVLSIYVKTLLLQNNLLLFMALSMQWMWSGSLSEDNDYIVLNYFILHMRWYICMQIQIQLQFSRCIL